MIFACDRCGRRYSVPDDRVQGRAFRVTCKACGQVIRVVPGAAAPAAARISSSVASGRAKRMFSRTVPLKRCVSCSTMPKQRRSESRVHARMSRPSKRMEPDTGS